MSVWKKESCGVIESEWGGEETAVSHKQLWNEVERANNGKWICVCAYVCCKKKHRVYALTTVSFVSTLVTRRSLLCCLIHFIHLYVWMCDCVVCYGWVIVRRKDRDVLMIRCALKTSLHILHNNESNATFCCHFISGLEISSLRWLFA